MELKLLSANTISIQFYFQTQNHLIPTQKSVNLYILKLFNYVIT
jgi:hypothetical protein